MDTQDSEVKRCGDAGSWLWGKPLRKLLSTKRGWKDTNAAATEGEEIRKYLY